MKGRLKLVVDLMLVMVLVCLVLAVYSRVSHASRNTPPLTMSRMLVDYVATHQKVPDTLDEVFGFNPVYGSSDWDYHKIIAGRTVYGVAVVVPYSEGVKLGRPDLAKIAQSGKAITVAERETVVVVRHNLSK